MKRSSMPTIRQLRWDEEPPDGEPRRYRNGAGYIRLRWKVGTSRYVETLEHRFVMGMPHPRFDVHHIDGDKTNNDPENLSVMTREEHASLHGAEQEREYFPYRSKQAKEKAERARERRVERDRRRRLIRSMYEDGATTIAIADELGLHHSTVSRELRSAGGIARTRGGGRGNTGPTRSTRQVVQARARMRCERCGRDLRWEPGQIHHRRPRKMGGTSRADANSPANLLLLCRSCHEWVESNREDAYEQGLLVREPLDPSMVPAVLIGGTLLLTADGRYTS